MLHHVKPGPTLLTGFVGVWLPKITRGVLPGNIISCLVGVIEDTKKKSLSYSVLYHFISLQGLTNTYSLSPTKIVIHRHSLSILQKQKDFVSLVLLIYITVKLWAYKDTMYCSRNSELLPLLYKKWATIRHLKANWSQLLWLSDMSFHRLSFVT